MYVYKQLLDRVDDVAYFGMPKNIENDGMINGTQELCSLYPKLSEPANPHCEPMTKTFYLQYQWMAFFMASLTILYFLPYKMYCKVNQDLILLKSNVKVT